MGIETLNKAARAAGFAMAAPDDEPVDEVAVPYSPSRALVPFVAEPPSLVPAPKGVAKHAAASALGSATDWVRGHLPAFGWRAPA